MIAIMWNSAEHDEGTMMKTDAVWSDHMLKLEKLVAIELENAM